MPWTGRNTRGASTGPLRAMLSGRAEGYGRAATWSRGCTGSGQPSAPMTRMLIRRRQPSATHAASRRTKSPSRAVPRDQSLRRQLSANAGRIPRLRRTRDRQHRRRDREGADAVGHAATGQNGRPAGIFATRPRRTSARDSRRRRTVTQNLKRLAARKHVIPNPSGDTATLTELPNSRSCNHTLTNAMTAARQHSPPTQTYKRYNILPVRLMASRLQLYCTHS